MGLDFLNHNYVRVAFYLIAAGACSAASIAESRRGDRGRWPWVWAGITTAVLIFGLGRELEFGHWITDRGREFAQAQGWYNERRPFQRLADVVVGLGGLAALALLASFSWRNWRSHTAAVFVLVLMAVFIAIRAISYHYTDAVLYRERWHGVELSAAIEVALTLLLTATALSSLAGRARHGRSAR